MPHKYGLSKISRGFGDLALQNHTGFWKQENPRIPGWKCSAYPGDRGFFLIQKHLNYDCWRSVLVTLFVWMYHLFMRIIFCAFVRWSWYWIWCDLFVSASLFALSFVWFEICSETVKYSIIETVKSTSSESIVIRITVWYSHEFPELLVIAFS